MFYELCQLDPNLRPSTRDALLDAFFTQEPRALSPAEAVREMRARRSSSSTKTRDAFFREEEAFEASPDRRDVPPGVRLLTDLELRETLADLGLDEELKALETGKCVESKTSSSRGGAVSPSRESFLV